MLCMEEAAVGFGIPLKKRQKKKKTKKETAGTHRHIVVCAESRPVDEYGERGLQHVLRSHGFIAYELHIAYTRFDNKQLLQRSLSVICAYFLSFFFLSSTSWKKRPEPCAISDGLFNFLKSIKLWVNDFHLAHARRGARWCNIDEGNRTRCCWSCWLQQDGAAQQYCQSVQNYSAILIITIIKPGIKRQLEPKKSLQYIA